MARTVSLLSIVTLMVPGTLGAQGLTLRPLEGEIGVRGVATSSTSASRLTSAQWIRLNLRGAVFDPRIIRFNLGLRPGLEQTRLDVGTENGRMTATDLGLDLGAGLLQGSSPVWFAGRFLRRTRDENMSGIFGDDRFALNTYASSEAHFDNSWMPLKLEYSYEDWSQRLLEAGTTIPGYTWKTVRFSGVSSKTSLFLERRISDAPTYYVNDIGSFENNQTWGKGSRLQVRGLGQQQRGDALVSSRNLDGYINSHLQHTRAVSSDWSFGIGEGAVGGAPVSRRSGELGLTWQTTRWLSLGARGNGIRQLGVGLNRTSYRAGPRAALAVQLPFRGALALTADVSREWLNLEATGDRLVVVAGEQYTVDPAGSFQLTNPGVDVSTIVVRGVAGLYQNGLDYTVVETGGFIDIVAVPGGRMSPGETVFVDYQYAPRGTGEARSIWANYTADLRIRWFRAYHRRWLRDPGARSVEEPLIGIRYAEQMATGAQLTLQSRRLTAIVMAERRLNVDGPFRLNASLLGANMSVRPIPRLSFGVQTRYQFGESPTSTNKLGMGALTTDWNPHHTLRLSGSVSAWRLTQDVATQSTEFGSSVRATWQPGLLQANLYYFYRTWDVSRIDDNTARPAQPLSQISLEIRRSF